MKSQPNTQSLENIYRERDKIICSNELILEYAKSIHELNLILFERDERGLNFYLAIQLFEYFSEKLKDNLRLIIILTSLTCTLSIFLNSKKMNLDKIENREMWAMILQCISRIYKMKITNNNHYFNETLILLTQKYKENDLYLYYLLTFIFKFKQTKLLYFSINISIKLRDMIKMNEKFYNYLNSILLDDIYQNEYITNILGILICEDLSVLNSKLSLHLFKCLKYSFDYDGTLENKKESIQVKKYLK
eukprot:gene4221-7558_t